MDIEEFLLSSPMFYGRVSIKPEKEGYLLDSAEGFNRHRGDYWTTFLCPGYVIPNQGWKVHLSASVDNISIVINAAVAACTRFNVHFKVVNTASQYLLSNGKNADRLSAGKLVTIYPSKENFEDLVAFLEGELQDQEGPEILTDLPGSAPCVHFRYGAFIPMKNEDGIYSIQDAEGLMIPDRREILRADEFPSDDISMIQHAKDRLKNNGQLNVTRVLLVKQSNAGGVFRCDFEGKPSYLKLGRWKAGLDRDGIDGWTRVKNEFKILEVLRDSGFTAEPERLLENGRTIVAVTGDLGADNLQVFKRSNFPIYGVQNGGWAEYLSEVLSICEQVKSAIKYMHSKGVFHRDLHIRNVLYSKGKVSIVDFEDAVLNSNSGPGKSKAQGYSNRRLLNSFEADWYSFRQIIQDLVFGNTSINEFNEGGWDLRWRNPYPSLLLEPEAVKLLRILENEAYLEGLFKDSSFYPTLADSLIRPLDPLILSRSLISRYKECIKQVGEISLAPYFQEQPGCFVYDADVATELLSASDTTTSTSNRESLSDCVFRMRFAADESGGFGKLSNNVQFDIEGHQPLWRSKVLQQLLGLSPGKERRDDSLFAQRWISKIIDEDWAGAFPSPLEENSNSWEDQRTGLLAGPLGIAWALSVWIDKCDVSTNMIVRYIRRSFDYELEAYELSESGGLFAVQGRRLLPYLATGSAGFGIVLAHLKRFRSELEFDTQAIQLLRATNAEFSICTGLLNGMSGLVLGQAGLQHFLGNGKVSNRNLIERVMRLLPHDGKGPVPLDDAGLRCTFDLAEGASGVLVAIRTLALESTGSESS